MENQGRRPDQIKFAEDVSFWAFLGLAVTLIIAALT